MSFRFDPLPTRWRRALLSLGLDLWRTARLADGSRVGLRPIRPRDVRELRPWLRSLSAESRYLRFHGYVDDLSPAQWRFLTSVDGYDHVALVARSGGRVAGVARFVRSRREPEVAEIAFLVADEVQGRGVGRALREALIGAALRRGVRSFDAHILAGNVGMWRLLDTPALELVRRDLLSPRLRLRPERAPAGAGGAPGRPAAGGDGRLGVAPPPAAG
jgi:RimJ/RimL family protein N-acetyltransferase